MRQYPLYQLYQLARLYHGICERDRLACLLGRHVGVAGADPNSGQVLPF